MISVIVPVYKVEKYLNKCIESIINQTYKNLEIILVDDGSPDNCPSICNEYAKKDDRIKVIHKENGGLSDARNVGIDAATGSYISFVDSDDYIAPDFLEIMHSTMLRENADLVICNYCYIDDNENILESNNKNSPVKDEVLTQNQIYEKLNYSFGWWYYVTAWNKLYRRELFDTIRFPKGKLNEDDFIAHEIFFACKRIVTIEKMLYFYVQRQGSIMSSTVTVRNLDEIEGFCKRISFYHMNGLEQYVCGSSQIMKHNYAKYMVKIKPTTKTEKQRISEIKKLFKDTYFSCKENRSIKNTIQISNPRLYVKYLKLKGKLRIRTRLRKMKKILKYRIGLKGISTVLIDTPTHGNLGDHAIVTAEKQFLAEQLSNIRYTELTATEINNDEKMYARFTPGNRKILIHGGGFMGKLWPDEEYRFRRILQSFTQHRVIVFPQTVTFDMETEKGLAFFEESKRIYEAHPDLTVFVREKKSAEFMKNYMPKINCILVPDIVTLMEVDIPKQVRSGILFCMRKDIEKNITQDEFDALTEAVKRHYPNEEISFTDTVADHMIQPQNREAEVKDKLIQFSKSKLLITDRLHGMVFAALTNTPCIALGNSNGKVGAVYEWIKSNEYIIYLNDKNDFEKALNKLDINKTYTYNRADVLKAFEPLVKALEEK